MIKIFLPLPGASSEKDQTAGFSSLLLLTGLSLAAGSLVYSATNRSINMKSMLQTSHYRASRDSIANSIRATVGVPNLLKHSASLDPSSPLNSCLDPTQTNQCLALDGSGNAIPHDLKVYDAQGRQLTGTPANPVYYDAQTGALCDATTTDPCELQATASFKIRCGGGVANCQGAPSANLDITFKVELKPSVPTLPDGTMLKPFDLNPILTLPLATVQAGVIMPSTVPPDANQSYTPISDPTTESNITVFNPATGSQTCNDMKALGNPAVFYDTYPVVGGGGTSYSSITGDLRASDETINNISSITGNVWATARTITAVSSVTAGGSGVDLNAVNIGNLSSITASHTSLVAHTIGSISSFTGHLYASADSIGSLSSITSNQYLVLVNRGWVSTGATGATPVSMNSITSSGNFLLCGFSVNSLSSITANFIGIANGSVVSNISSLTAGQLTIYSGGSLGNISSSTINNLTLYNTNVGNISSVTGNIQAYGGTINSVDNMSGNIDLYNGATITTVGGSFTGTITNH